MNKLITQFVVPLLLESVVLSLLLNGAHRIVYGVEGNLAEK